MEYRPTAKLLPGPFDEWVATRGPTVADALEMHRDAICAATTAQMIKTFPRMCYEPHRFDAAAFQLMAVQQTPQRFHKLVRVVLMFQSFSVIDQEYQWACGVLPRHGVNRTHMLAAAGWYFNAARTLVPLRPRDKAFFNGLKRQFLQQISEATVGLAGERA